MVDERDSLAPGSEQLQTAARAVIDAARALLDVAERLVADPTTLQTLFSTMRDAARDGMASFASMAGQTGSPQSETIDVREESDG